MFTSPQATRLWMLAFALAAIPLAMLIELIWERLPTPWAGRRGGSPFRVAGKLRGQRWLAETSGFEPGLSRHPLLHPLFLPLPFYLAVAILTGYLVVALISNSL